MAPPSESTPTSRKRKKKQQAPSPYQWSPWFRGVVTLFLLWHCGAVLLGPTTVWPAPRLFRTDLVQLYQPYLECFYLTNGYRFFAPNPGPSHLLHWELTKADGSQETGFLPDKEKHWPRLFYHRHFMLSEKVEGGPPLWRESYARHLLLKHDAQEVKLSLERHYLPRMHEIREGLDPNDASYYERISLGNFRVNEDQEAVLLPPEEDLPTQPPATSSNQESNDQPEQEGEAE
ncbi:Hypothetical protein PBC10988_12350 [Planctomycetales bacterium 10988]|nr:Hypothetical protein PBC10988_12350 [Planctomycetales bacterium 10988]